ncbi:hypothetical protein [Xanthomonas axonopodis]
MTKGMAGRAIAQSLTDAAWLSALASRRDRRLGAWLALPDRARKGAVPGRQSICTRRNAVRTLYWSGDDVLGAVFARRRCLA